MRNKFDEQLVELHEEIVKMGNTMIRSLQKAVEALVTQDLQMAEDVIQKDVKVNHLQKRIESICFNLLIQQQPVARDLRTVTAAMKMVTDMERIGDHAADISEMTITIGKTSHINQFEHIAVMISEIMVMLNQCMESFIEKDTVKANAVITHDDIIDTLFSKAKKDIIQLIIEDPNDTKEATNILMIAKYLERIGDHATNIAEWVLYSLQTSDTNNN